MRLQKIFNEYKNRLFGCILTIINDSVTGNDYDEKSIEGFLRKSHFLKKNYTGKHENSRYKDALLNKSQMQEKDNFYILREDNYGHYKPSIDNKVPIRMSIIEKQWLGMILSDPRIKLFIDVDTVEKLGEKLEDVDSPYRSEYIIEKNIDNSDEDMESEVFAEFFKTISKAINEGRFIKYDSISKEGIEFKNEIVFPFRIEYSPKNNKFRLSAFNFKENRPIKINISSFKSIEVVDCECEEPKERMMEALEKKKNKMKVEIDSDITNSLERFLYLFSFYEKTARHDEKRKKYIFEVYYYVFDEGEIIRDILSLGKSAVVVEPEGMRNKIIARLKRTLERVD